MSFKFLVGQAVEYTPMGEKAAGFYKVMRQMPVDEIAPEPTGHGLPLSKCEAYNRVYDQRSRSS